MLAKLHVARNITYHYDLGNQFYEKWLDNSMTYSSAIFADGEDRLDAAQRRKYERLAELADIQPGDRVLEIGCGWGGFAEYAAAERGALIDGITISPSQHDFAKTRIEKAGLAEKANIRICDYRDLNKTYDKIVSIEMFEAVGEAPHHSVIEVRRDGSHKVLATDPEVDHDFHVFDDGSVLFARGFVDKGQAQYSKQKWRHNRPRTHSRRPGYRHHTSTGRLSPECDMSLPPARQNRWGSI